MLFLVPYSSISMDARHDVLELARFLAELSVLDYYFVPAKASSVALACLLNAMNEIRGVSDEVVQDFVQYLRRLSGLNKEDPEVLKCRERLHLLYAQGGYAAAESQPKRRTEAISPVCVSYGLPVATQQTTGDSSAALN